MKLDMQDACRAFPARVVLAAAVGALGACGALPDATTQDTAAALIGFNAADFVNPAPNPFFPLVPGTTYRFVVTLDPTSDQTITEITHQTRRILGVDTLVIHDRSLLKGKVVEDTFDFIKGDRFGNVRYFGEDTKELDPDTGQVTSTAGSFIAGSNGAATPQILMEAHPKVGDVYFEELAPNDEAEDQAEVTSLNKSISVPISPERALHGCLETRNFTALEPDSKERKVYCSGLGVVVTDAIKGDPKHEALVSITHD